VRLVLDTNTALSGLLWDGAPCRLIEAAENGSVTLFSSVALQTELPNVLAREKVPRALARRGIDVAGIFTSYVVLVTIVAPALISPTITRDPADDAVLATPSVQEQTLSCPGMLIC
jgi:putative PIN family toxin of toxin-antitoxin system